MSTRTKTASTKPVEFPQMERRIRFGSDGNGIFVAVSKDHGKTWAHFDDARLFLEAGRWSRDVLEADEFCAGYRFLTGEWNETMDTRRAEPVDSVGPVHAVVRRTP